jgi:hypothetical protein
MINSEIIEELQTVKNLLLKSSEYGMQSEVVTWALQNMKENPNLSIGDAMEIGYSEWIK